MLGLLWSWKLSCSENRAHLPNCEQLLCPLCGIDNCYTLSMSVYVACSGCKTLRRSERFMAHGGAHVIENHPGCTLCWQCITEAEECPICGLEGPFWNLTILRICGLKPNEISKTDSINCDYHISMLFPIFDTFKIFISHLINESFLPVLLNLSRVLSG